MNTDIGYFSCLSTSSIVLFLAFSTALSYLPVLAFILVLFMLSESYPKFREGAQSGLLSSNNVEGEPNTKWSEHTQVFGYFSGLGSFIFTS